MNKASNLTPTQQHVGFVAISRSAQPSPAGRQARWLLAASARLPIPAAELTAHFDPTFLAHVPPAQLNAALTSAGGLLRGDGAARFASIVLDQPRHLEATVARGSRPAQLSVMITVDDHGLISGLLIKPISPAALSSWGAIDEAVRSVAPRVHMLVADTTGGSCMPIHATTRTPRRRSAPRSSCTCWRRWVRRWPRTR